MRSAWSPVAEVHAAAELVDAVVADVRRGRLKPGERLPGARALALSLGLNRKTVAAAFAELEAQGWVRIAEGSGAYVDVPGHGAAVLAPNGPTQRSGGPAAPGAAGFPLPAIVDSGAAVRWDGANPRYATRAIAGGPAAALPMLHMAGGQPDLRVLPVEEVGRAWRRALAGAGRALVDYAGTRGEPTLREALADWLGETRGVAAQPEGLLVTRGAQGALYLLARAVLRPGDRVAVEAWGYGPAWAVFREAGLELVPVPVDAGGIDVDALARLPNLRAVYVTPHHQYPTGAVLSPTRRAALLALAAARRMAILEDDYDHEFHYVGRPVLPLAAADTHGVVVYVGTLSKALAPGLRIGFVVAAPPVVDRLAAYRRIVDRQGDHVTERAVAELIRDGSLGRHIRRSRRTYERRREVLRAALAGRFGDELEPNDPPGGMALWVTAPGVDVDAWAARAGALGVGITTARAYAFDPAGPEAAAPCVRMGFACLDETELVEAVRRLRAGWMRG